VAVLIGLTVINWAETGILLTICVSRLSKDEFSLSPVTYLARVPIKPWVKRPF
jgi:hypothetical protein